MKLKWKKSYQLDMETIKRWIRTSLIIFIPVLILILTQLWTWAELSKELIFTAVCSSLADLLRRFSTDYSLTK
jgi:hypothetical protein